MPNTPLAFVTCAILVGNLRVNPFIVPQQGADRCFYCCKREYHQQRCPRFDHGWPAGGSFKGISKLVLNSWTVAAVAEHCQRHIQRYRHRLDHDLGYCLELFRRAFEERSEEAYTHLYQTYISLIYHWVYHHPYFPSLDMPADYYVADCMSHFFLTMQGNLFERFQSVPAILRYWQKCVHTILLNDARKKRVATVPIENVERYPDEAGLDERLVQSAIWQRVETLLPENKDRLLAHLVFVQGLKPKQIVEHYTALWVQTNEVRVDRQRITRCLVGDPTLRQLLGMDKRPN